MSDDAIELGPYSQGEIPEPVTHTFEKSDGTPDPLTGGTWTSKLEFRRWNTTTPVTEKSATVENQGTLPGQVTWTWVAADVSAYGDFEGELWVGNTPNGARYRSQRFRWLVKPSIATPGI